MNEERVFLEKRFRELAAQAERRGSCTYTPFLTEAEQAVLAGLARSLPVPFALNGGAETCERRIARFGTPAEYEDGDVWPIVCLKVAAKSKRFMEELGHRDYLGAFMHLGAERETIGDIFPGEDGAYVFCLETAARLAEELLLTVRRTSVTVERTEPPAELLTPELTEETVRVTNERADAVVAHVYALSREKAQQLFREGLVFRNGAQLMNDSATLKDGDILSVRGYGRFRFAGVTGLTKKGKKTLKIERYGAKK
ncbi:MAG: YlmH/Sll1252 family protein [Clostridia bacterium]|nr:YlmH/Sll1252 family protein [Clostridia bacterium]